MSLLFNRFDFSPFLIKAKVKILYSTIFIELNFYSLG